MSIEDTSKANQLIDSFKKLYSNLNHSNCNTNLIDQLYDQNMLFKDSFHTINGVDEFKAYCASLYENLNSCEFDFHKAWIGQGDAMLTWTMRYSHPRLNGGRVISVEGASEICFEDKIFTHQDYFDGGNLLYEHVPLLGTVISQLKKRMSA